MLFDVPSMKKLTRVPYEETYRPLRQALDKVNPNAFPIIHNELTSRFHGRQIDTSSWIPGKDWTGTIYDPIYVACGLDEAAAAKFFGQIVWQVVMDLDSCWASGHYELDGVQIKGRTYFSIDCPK
ncbi:hypothetical protein RBB75_15595 [Tunturibacter empetritectus]|uniref:Uncharacterized protein n=1 Tax=Tunturiibacter empetritectus TaxID=3069691 RepID=A0AAU7ZAJ1_9BACT